MNTIQGGMETAFWTEPSLEQLQGKNQCALGPERTRDSENMNIAIISSELKWNKINNKKLDLRLDYLICVIQDTFVSKSLKGLF